MATVMARRGSGRNAGDEAAVSHVDPLSEWPGCRIFVRPLRGRDRLHVRGRPSIAAAGAGSDGVTRTSALDCTIVFRAVFARGLISPASRLVLPGLIRKSFMQDERGHDDPHTDAFRRFIF